MNLDDLVRRSDPTRSRTDQAGPGLLDRILTAGPAPSPTGGRNAVLAAVLTAVVTLSVVGGIALVRRDAPAPAAPSPSGSSLSSPPVASPTSPGPVDCLGLIRGWRPTYLPPGFALHGPEQVVASSLSRQQDYVRKSARQPTTTTYLSLSRSCADPAAQRPGRPTREPGTATATALPQLTIRGHPATLSDYGAVGADLIRIDWYEEPNLLLTLMTSSSTPGGEYLSVPELIRVAAGLVHEQATADPPPPPASCPGLTSYRAATLPPGYRVGVTKPTDEDNLILTYVKGTGARAVTITVILSCEVVVEHDPPVGFDPVTINGKRAWISRPGRPVQAIWKEGPVEFWIIVGSTGPDEPQPTRAEVLTVARSLRPK